MQDNLIIKISTGKAIHTQFVKNQTMTYDEFANMLNTFERPKIKEKYEDMSPEDIKKVKSQSKFFIPAHFAKSGNGTVRQTIHLLYRTMIVYDIDKYLPKIEHLEEEIYENLGKYEYLYYSTFSHTPEAPKLRLILFVDESILEGLYSSVSYTFAEYLTFGNSIDPASFKSNQPMFYGSYLNPKYKRIFKANHGEILKTRDLVDTSGYTNTPLINRISSSTSVGNTGGSYIDIDKDLPNLESSKNQFKGNPSEIVLRGQTYDPKNHRDDSKLMGMLHCKPLDISERDVDLYLRLYPAALTNYNTWFQVACALRIQYKTHLDKGFEKFLNWSLSDERLGIKYLEDEVRESVYKAWANAKRDNTTRAITFATIIKLANDNKSKVIKRATEALDAKSTPDEVNQYLKKLEDYGVEDIEEYLEVIKKRTALNIATIKRLYQNHKHAYRGLDRIYDTTERLPSYVFRQKDHRFYPMAIDENFKILLEAYNLKLRYNVTSKKVELINFHTSEVLTEPDNVMALLGSLLTINNIRFVMDFLYTLINTNAKNNKYNPIMEWITSNEWDGVDRLDAICNVLVPEKAKDSEYPLIDEDLKRVFIRKWLLSIVAANSNIDGFFSKGVLILQGTQSIGKTSFFRGLLPSHLCKYTGICNDFKTSNKDNMILVITKAIVEISEMETIFRGGDVESLKSFISQTNDEVRSPYGRQANKEPRTMILCGTVNSKRFLTDLTGNVRFWVVPVAGVDFTLMESIDMQQLFAQMKHELDNGATWHLTREELSKCEVNNGQYLLINGHTLAVHSVYNMACSPEEHKNAQSISQIYNTIYGYFPSSVQATALEAALKEKAQFKDCGNGYFHTPPLLQRY